MRKRETIKTTGLVCLILILVLVMIYSGLQLLESTVFSQDTEAEHVTAKKTITRNGVDYFPRQDITVMMIIGVDEVGPVVESPIYNNSSASDTVLLLIVDEKNKEFRVLSLNRDTMLEMPVLGLNGQQAGTDYGQLALAHTYGSGLEDSCENTRKAVSKFLNGITIDYYVSMNMDAISVLNDAVGGVTVTVVDDFSEVDPTLVQGEVTLQGEQAINFVRSRRAVGNQMNVSRMERHREFAEGFFEAFRMKTEQDELFALSAYEEVSPYLVTDCSANALSSMMERYADYEMVEFVSPEGENMLGEEYYEFYVDEEKLDELILRLFYAPK